MHIFLNLKTLLKYPVKTHSCLKWVLDRLTQRLFFSAWLLIVSIFYYNFADGQAGQSLKAADVVNTNAKIKAMFIYNFTKYIEWPDEFRKGNFTIGLVGNADLFKELIKLSGTKNIGNQPLEVKTFTSIESITYCHILFVGAEKSDLLPAVLNKINGYNTLLITDKEGIMKQGSAINFVIRNSKQEFELNRPVVKKFGLSPGSQLATLAVTVL